MWKEVGAGSGGTLPCLLTSSSSCSTLETCLFCQLWEELSCFFLGGLWCGPALAVHGVTKRWTWLSDWITTANDVVPWEGRKDGVIDCFSRSTQRSFNVMSSLLEIYRMQPNHPPPKAPLFPLLHLVTLFFHLESPSLQHPQLSTSESPEKKCCAFHESILEMCSWETTMTVCLSRIVTGLIPTH